MTQNTNKPSPEKKGDKNAKPKFNSNWIFAIIALSFILFEILFSRNVTEKATTSMIKDMITKRDIEKIVVVNKDQAEIYLTSDAVSSGKYENLPRVFLHLLEQAEEVIKIVKKIPPDEAKYHWNLAYEPNSKQKINEWTNRIIRYSSEILRDSRSFIIHLLGDKLEKKDCPPEIKEEMGKYGLD